MDLSPNDIYEALHDGLFRFTVASLIILFILFLSAYGFIHYTKRIYEEGSKITLWIGLLISAAGFPGSLLLCDLMVIFII
jgi:hypothetical protein